MPYIIEVVKAGNTIEVSKYYSSRFNKKGVKRGKRKQLTTDEQREVNKRAAEKKLRRLINENFQEGFTPVKNKNCVMVNEGEVEVSAVKLVDLLVDAKVL